MSNSNPTKVFVDLSVLMDFCRVYSDNNFYSNKALKKFDEEGYDIWISETARGELNSRAANRQRLLDYLIRQCSKYINEDRYNMAEFKSEVLTFSNLVDNLAFDVNERHLPDLESLQRTLSLSSESIRYGSN